MKRILLPLAALALSLATAWAQPETRSVPNRLLVKFKADVSDTAATNALRNTGGTWRTLEQIKVHIVNASSNALQALKNRNDIEWAEEDEIVPPSAPNDPYYASEWHLTTVQAPGAWPTTIGSSGLTIAILDTGIDATHPDLASRLVTGWNVADNNSTTTDTYGHGTAVAGVAGALTSNGVGVASMTWGCKLMPVRISSSGDGSAFTSTMASGLTWAADHGAKVANLSYQASSSAAVTSAAQYLQGKGGVTVSAAGNTAYFDTAADNPYILTISATDVGDTITSWSGIGNNIDLCAPGTSIMTTGLGGTYVAATGTSFSTPIVAGVAALVMSANTNLTAAQVQTLLKNTANDIGVTGWDPIYGWGRVNASNAVAHAGGTVTPPTDTIAPTISITYPASGQVVSNTVPVALVSSDNVGITVTKLYAGTTLIGTSAVANVTFNWNTTNLADGSVVLAGYAYDAANNVASNTVTVTTRNHTDTVAPSVTFSSPAAGDTVSNTVSIVLAATDNVGVTKVDCYANLDLIGTSTSANPTFSWNTGTTANGSYILKAVATDIAGNTGYTTIGVTVTNTVEAGDTTDPVVAITSPINGATVTKNVSVAMTATDDVQVAKVTLLADGYAVGTTTTSPYVVRWNTQKVSKGYHLLSATATDTSGNVGTSAAVSVRVR